MRQSFKLRLTLAYTLSLSLILIVFGLTSYWGLKRVLEYNLDKALNVVAKSEADFASHTEEIHLHDIRNVLPGQHETGALQRFAQITDLNGELIVANHPLKPSSLTLDSKALKRNRMGEPVFSNVTLQEQAYRMLYLPFKRGETTYSIQVATPLAPIKNTLNRMLELYFVFGGGALLLSAFVGYRLAKRVIAPIQTITQAAQLISLNNLDEQIPDHGNGEDELSQLVVVLNGMLQRLDNSVAVLRHFTANASHELRTPLTILKGEIQVALRRGRSSEDYQSLLQSNLEEVNRLIQLTEALLQLERGERWDGEVQTCLVRPVLDKIRQRFLPRAQEQGVELVLEVTLAEQKIAMAEGDLTQILYNLMDNALGVSQPQSQITLRSGIKDAHCWIEVRDQGPGIPEEDQRFIFDRFYQVEKSHSGKNFGIGLSICKALMEKYGGHIRFESDTAGTCFKLRLPCVPTPEVLSS